MFGWIVTVTCAEFEKHPVAIFKALTSYEPLIPAAYEFPVPTDTLLRNHSYVQLFNGVIFPTVKVTIPPKHAELLGDELTIVGEGFEFVDTDNCVVTAHVGAAVVVGLKV